MIYGGVAAKYALYTLVGEPYKKDGKPGYYILAKAPFSKGDPIEIKWYTDKSHAANMPNKAPKKELWEIFGFKSADDKILYYRDRTLSNPTPGWRACAIMNGIWYAPIGTPTTHATKEITWPEFEAERNKYKKQIGVE